MRTEKNRTLAMLLSALMLLCSLTACGSRQGSSKDGDPSAKNLGILHEEEFGGVYAQMTIDEFNALGFAYGDSLDVTFSNGYALKGIPYYNGYYTKTGEPLLVAYPGYPYIKICINNGDDLFLLAGLTEQDRVTISCAERGTFQAIQNARDIHYQDDRSLFSSDAVFANFRAVSAGTIAEGMLCRSASPCDNQHNRAGYVDALMGQAGVNLILDLADTEEKIAGYLEKEGFDSPAFLTLYKQGQVVPLGLNMNFASEEFRAKIVRGLAAMSETPGPYLVHCTEGKDRTGFVCMLLEALCGADYAQIVEDYMITYDNYYGITKQKDPDRYNVIVREVLEPMMQAVTGEDADLVTADFAAAAETYLLNAGMTKQQIEALRANLSAVSE